MSLAFEELEADHTEGSGNGMARRTVKGSVVTAGAHGEGPGVSPPLGSW
jgi:hypothetical protein